MKKQNHSKGFTLLETIIVLVILAILAAILVPLMVGWIRRSNQLVCEINRNEILRHYHYVQVLEYAKDTDVKLSDVLAGKYKVNADDIVGIHCPAGGVYTADDEKGLVLCSIHGGMTEETSGESETTQPTSQTTTAAVPTNTADYFYLAGDVGYKVATWGDLEKFEPAHDGQPGTTIPTGAVFYYKGSYYFFRDNQYITKDTNLASYVAGYGIKINNAAFTTASPSSTPGDVKLKDGKPYVFFPYGRFYEDYYNDSCWYTVATE